MHMLTSLLLSAGLLVSPGQSSPLQSFYHQKLAWSDCGGGFQCAKLSVPLDYARPGKEKITISVIRLPASGRNRIGSLVLNPGGPGGSGVQYAKSAKSVVTDGVRQRFDIVGFDPRGVGDSTPVRCLSGKQLDAYMAVDSTPDTKAEVRELKDASKLYGQACQAKAGKLLAHVGTEDAARDMDVLRAALGDKGLTYLGKSYGTYLGATYADLFPKKVRALVLDGAVDPTLPFITMNGVQARGFETAFEAFAKDCFAAGDCPFTGRTVKSAYAELAKLLKAADTKPLRNTQDSRRINESIVITGVLTPLYDHAAWPVLRQALANGFKGDGTILLRIADIYFERDPDGSFSNQNDANTAINCLDRSYPASPEAYARKVAKAVKKAPHFGPYVAGGVMPCAYWPVRSKGTDKPLRAKGSGPIVVVGTLRDPATPYAWAQALAKQLDAGVLISYDGDGHTAYKTNSTCVDRLVDAYLIGQSAPAEDISCPKVG
ncbi:alpha/beta hydrolase [Nonomuraea sp. NPDC050556]|uniref:alpha/beta hydrolase n=1 Tax=Nonomuraea sp. NPDC050556 TaxID=3364369 RepID=UPI0037B4A11C